LRRPILSDNVPMKNAPMAKPASNEPTLPS